MRRTILIILSILVVFQIQSQDTYYYYKGEQRKLQTVDDKQYVLFNNTIDTIELKNNFKKMGSRFGSLNNLNVMVNTLNNQKVDDYNSYYWAIVNVNNSDILLDKNVVYSAPFFRTRDNILVGLSHLFYVKLKSLKDIDLLNSIAIENKVQVLGNNEYMPLWFTLSCSNQSKGNALEMANLFYETGYFVASEPDIMVDDLLTCANNDTYFSDQWALNNVGQKKGIIGIDINYCQARDITTGSSDIVVAILDHGVQLDHPDLTNMYHLSYNTENNSSPSNLEGGHGTACAGIIGATVNNEIGVVGIAPDCPIMSISNKLEGTPDSRMKRANGINFAWQNGASIISNSWDSDVPYSVIDDAINNALVRGRDGKGCVVVFSSGNKNGGVSYPANSNSDILVVGAISQCGERKSRSSCDGIIGWGSNYGQTLDVVAPGVFITTTDVQGDEGYNPHGENGNADYFDKDYTKFFDGTSAACPHVSGVAALVLSVNSELTAQQVRDIIESTAQKVRPDLYTYTNDGVHNNGTWNNEMGYGLVDAYAAVKKAQEYKYSDLYVRDVEGDNGMEPSVTNGIMWDSPDIWIEDMNGNKISNPYGNAEYKVCVRVHNRSEVSSTGEERLFLNWAKVGIDLVWRENWTSENVFDCGAVKGGVIGSANGVKIPVIAANGSEVVKVTWLTQ